MGCAVGGALGMRTAIHAGWLHMGTVLGSSKNQFGLTFSREVWNHLKLSRGGLEIGIPSGHLAGPFPQWGAKKQLALAPSLGMWFC